MSYSTYSTFLSIVETFCPVVITEQESHYSVELNQIVLQEGLSEELSLITLIHEFGHFLQPRTIESRYLEEADAWERGLAFFLSLGFNKPDGIDKVKELCLENYANAFCLFNEIFSLEEIKKDKVLLLKVEDVNFFLTEWEGIKEWYLGWEIHHQSSDINLEDYDFIEESEDYFIFYN